MAFEPEAPPSLDTIVEAALLASDAPLDLEALLQLFEEQQAPSRSELLAALATLEQRLAGTAMTLLTSASGFRLVIDSALAPWLTRLWEERPQRYSRALMETLALIAYRQPVTRSDIEEVRGVAVSASIMRTLLDRGWVRVIGQRDVPGRPSVYATTRRFLDDFNLTTLNELPSMPEVHAQFGALALPQERGEGGDSAAAAMHNQAVLRGAFDEDAGDDALDDPRRDSDASHRRAPDHQPPNSHRHASDAPDIDAHNADAPNSDALDIDALDIDALVPPPLAGEALDFSTLQARLDARMDAVKAARKAQMAEDTLDKDYLDQNEA